MDVRNLSGLLTEFSERWSPKTVATLNDYEIKLVKVQGAPNEDYTMLNWVAPYI